MRRIRESQVYDGEGTAGRSPAPAFALCTLQCALGSSPSSFWAPVCSVAQSSKQPTGHVRQRTPLEYSFSCFFTYRIQILLEVEMGPA